MQQPSDHLNQGPATGLEAMMGLDNMGEMEMPDMFGPGAMGGPGQPAGMTEEEMIARAI